MSKPRKLIQSLFVASAIVSPSIALSDDASVVLVHGAFSDGSAWNKVIPILHEAGVTVSAAQLSLASLESDADAVTRLLDLQDGPVVLVGHSYGGNVITAAGAHDKVAHLVFVAGFALNAGQSLSDLTEGQPAAPWQAEVYPDAAGYLRLTLAGMSQFFAPDLPAETTALMTVTQGPIKYQATYDAPSVAAWTTKPSSYVIAENDQIISPKVQGYFAQKIGADTTTVASSHAAMLSQPDAVAKVILDAVVAASDS